MVFQYRIIFHVCNLRPTAQSAFSVSCLPPHLSMRSSCVFIVHIARVCVTPVRKAWRYFFMKESEAHSHESAFGGKISHLSCRRPCWCSGCTLIDEFLGSLSHLLDKNDDFLDVVLRCLLCLVQFADPTKNCVLLVALLPLIFWKFSLLLRKPSRVLSCVHVVCLCDEHSGSS